MAWLCLLTSTLKFKADTNSRHYSFTVEMVYSFLLIVFLFLWAGRCLAISRKVGMHNMLQLPGKTSTIIPKIFPFLLPKLYMLSMMQYSVKYPFGQLGISCPSCVATQFLVAPPASSLVRQYETQKMPCLLCECCLALTKTSLHY